MILLIILVSSLIQISAAYLAIRMIRISRHVTGWILISSALLLMGFRRITTLLGHVLPDTGAILKGVGAETIALCISLFMLGGVILIRKYILRQQRIEIKLFESEQKYKELSDQLELRITEKSIQLSQAHIHLQESKEVKSDFLSMMSHELRTPLNSIMGFSDILLTGIDGELTQEQKKDAQLIFNSATHLLQLINDILDYSKLESGKLILKPGWLSIETIVSSTVENYEDVIRGKGLYLSNKIPPDLPPLYSDSQRIDQILSNLIDNAVKFTDQGGMTIETEWTDQQGRTLEQVPEDRKGYLKISIQDTGIGIAEKNISKIFAGFHQTESGVSRRYEGTGLGLAISHNLVELHGGSMGVESQPGNGSRFWFTIPTYRIEGLFPNDTDREIL